MPFAKKMGNELNHPYQLSVRIRKKYNEKETTASIALDSVQNERDGHLMEAKEL